MLITHFLEVKGKEMIIRTKGYLLLILVLLAVVVAACSSSATTLTQLSPTATNPPTTTTPSPAQTSDLPDRVDMVYFQRSNHCHCMAVIGENIQLVVLKEFQDEVTTGKLTFKMLASDDEANIDMVKKYDTPPFGLFLTIVKGKTEKVVPVEEIWGMTGDEAKYKEYVKNTIAKSLNGEI
jgi:hypothetical protein